MLPDIPSLVAVAFAVLPTAPALQADRTQLRIRPGGDPAASAWWLAGEAERWEEIV
ncbi:MAG: hypothetical protein AAGG01_16255 [Planctomycetota bacterium]